MTRYDLNELRRPLVADQRSIEAIRRSRHAAQKALDERLVVRRLLEARLTLPRDRRDRAAEDAAEHATQDLATLDTGDFRQGWWDSALRQFSEGPGIVQLQAFIAECDQSVAQEEERLSHTWPAPFRYVGPKPIVLNKLGSEREQVDPALRTWFNGRALQVGDVVMLNETQAAAMADRFEPVAHEQVTT